MIQTVVLVTVPGTKTPAWVRLHGFRRFPPREPLRLSPVHASQSQVDVWILEQHSGEEVLLGGMDQERCVYDLHTHKCVFVSTVQLCLSCGGCGGALRLDFIFSTLNSCRLASGSHNSFSTLPPTTNRAVTTPISTQEKMNENPTPLKEEHRSFP